MGGERERDGWMGWMGESVMRFFVGLETLCSRYPSAGVGLGGRLVFNIKQPTDVIMSNSSVLSLILFSSITMFCEDIWRKTFCGLCHWQVTWILCFSSCSTTARRVMSPSLFFFDSSILLFLISPLPQVCYTIQESIQFLIVRLRHQ